jgi:CubicO group peptidase (beta-lactamase class C family)
LAIIQGTTGQHADRFARGHLFGPLDIDSYSWPGDPQGYTNTGGSFGGLSLKPRDLAKFGYLFLDHGRWNGKQVIPEDWVMVVFTCWAGPENADTAGPLMTIYQAALND